MKIFIIILMFVMTIFAINLIVENGKAVKVNETVTGFKYLTVAACISIALLGVSFNAACLYLLAFVV